MSITENIGSRGIEEVVHFTTNRGLVGMLAEGAVLSRRNLPTNKYLEKVAYNNAKFRPEEAAQFDRSEDWLDYINLSISEINSHFFGVSKGWHKNDDVWWVIVSFSPDIMSDPGVYFATTNNKYGHCKRRAGEAGFEALFESPIRREGTWVAHRLKRAPHLATCQQAEVLYPGRLGLDRLLKIYVANEEHCDVVKGWLREWDKANVPVVIAPKKFDGVPN